MATIGKNYLTLKDMYSQMEGDGKVTAAIIDLFMSSNAILEDAIAVECNQGTSHKTTVRNGLPQPQFRKFYQGVECQKGDYTTVTDSTSMLDDYSEVDTVNSKYIITKEDAVFGVDSKNWESGTSFGRAAFYKGLCKSEIGETRCSAR